MKKNITALGFLLFLFINTFSFAAESNPYLAAENDVKAKLQEKFKDLKNPVITYLPEVKLFEVDVNGNILYTNQSLDFVVTGLQVELLDINTKKNITVERDILKTKELFNKFPFKDSISYKIGKGTRKIAIFSDPDCPFCRKLDTEIFTNLINRKDLDLTIHYFMNPLDGNPDGGPHPDARRKAKVIWCSRNPSQAWKDHALTGKLPADAPTCKNPVDENKKLAERMNLNSTPTIMFDNGYVVRQVLTLDKLVEVLNKRKP